MLGALIGDIVGSVYEWRNRKDKEFPLFQPDCRMTDDSVMTAAVASAVLMGDLEELELFQAHVITEMRRLGRKYPALGYGPRFEAWILSQEPKPYRSLGNGSAMRVSPAAWLATDMAETLHLARLTAKVTHDHPEGIKGAQATAAAIFLARTGHSKPEIRQYVEQTFGYDLSRTCDEIRPGYRHVETCQQTVPEAIIAFLESNSFEDALRNAVSLGGDSDTLACITGGIAEAFYGMPSELQQETLKRLPEEMRAAYALFRQNLERRM